MKHHRWHAAYTSRFHDQQNIHIKKENAGQLNWTAAGLAPGISVSFAPNTRLLEFPHDQTGCTQTIAQQPRRP